MTKPAYSPTKIKSLTALKDTVIVSNMDFDERITSSGIVIINDDMKSSGIRPRWAQVYAIGPDQLDVTVGQYILVSHGRWTRGIKIEDSNGPVTIRKVDMTEILMVSDTLPADYTMGDKVI
jgi:hypothetical protein